VIKTPLILYMAIAPCEAGLRPSHLAMTRTKASSLSPDQKLRSADGLRLAHRLTERLTWRPIKSQDLPHLIAIFSQPAVVAHRPNPTPETPSDCRRRLDQELDHWQRHGFGRWVLEYMGAVVGFGGLTFRDSFAGLNLSYHLHPSYWRLGLASEFARAAVDIALHDLEAPQVVGMVRPVNQASQRVLEKAGLTFQRPITYGGHPGLLYLKRRGKN
jgi:ribosomal-protein-alanine N-acetyltransferase